LQEQGGGKIQIFEAAHPWQHVRPVGEDIIKGDLLIMPYQEIRPIDVASLLNAGVFSVTVFPRPTVAILPTGSELIPPESTPEPGQVFESNSQMMAAYLFEDGADPQILPPCKDERESLLRAVRDALGTCDILFVLSGSSAGSKDLTRGILEELGEVIFHGVAMMPGKPALFGLIQDTPVFGIPGYPTSAALFYEEVVRPFLERITGRKPVPASSLEARVFRKVPSKLGQEEFIRVRLGKIKGEWIAVPLPRGAGVLKSLNDADGIIRVPINEEGVSEASLFPVTLRRDLAELEGQLLFIGSHDLSLDRLNVLLRKEGKDVALAIGAVGSLAGLFALRQGKAHLTAIHLLDPETQTYNLPYLKKYLGEWKVRRILLLKRTQGLMVRKGNPKGIRSIRDLAREDVQFVNRQRGAGTRVLLDYLLEKEGIAPASVAGYRNEVATHAMVAAEIRGGMADCGMGIQAAAQALDLDFVPLAEEPYELIIPEDIFGDYRISVLLEAIRSEAFKKAVEALGGYDTRHSGEEMPV